MKTWYVGTIKLDATDDHGLNLARNRGKKVYMYERNDVTGRGFRMFRGKYPSDNNSPYWNWRETIFSEIRELA
jgi:hypothetical protein